MIVENCPRIDSLNDAIAHIRVKADIFQLLTGEGFDYWETTPIVPNTRRFFIRDDVRAMAEVEALEIDGLYFRYLTDDCCVMTMRWEA